VADQTLATTTGPGTALATEPDPSTVPAAERGTLDVRTKALEHLVEAAALQVRGIVKPQRSLTGIGTLGSLGSLVGGGAPSASVSLDGRGARVEVDVAAAWPCRASVLAADVRLRVLEEVTRLSGIPIRTVDVTIHLVDPEDVDHTERRRVQ
jgi:uncharacterized alkaline shock family protein YloU